MIDYLDPSWHKKWQYVLSMKGIDVMGEEKPRECDEIPNKTILPGKRDDTRLLSLSYPKTFLDGEEVILILLIGEEPVLML